MWPDFEDVLNAVLQSIRLELLTPLHTLEE
jgi:hypothetical protein